MFRIRDISDPDPDPWIRTSGTSPHPESGTFQMRAKDFSSNFFCLFLLKGTFTSFFKDKKNHIEDTKQ